MKKLPALKCQQCSMFYQKDQFCAHITGDELSELGRESRNVVLKRGEAFNSEALEIWPVVAVSSGVLSMQHLLEDGRKTIAAFFMQGDIIDLRGISNRNRGHLISLGKTNVCRLSPKIFERIVLENPDAQQVVWQNIRNQNFRAIDHSADLAKKKALEKLASFIFECRSRQVNQAEEGLVKIPVRRIDLAEYLGMQPETVSRCFRDLEDRGILSITDISLVKILSVATLRRIANGDKNAGKIRKPEKNNFKILSFG